jgi:hypothetical protein
MGSKFEIASFERVRFNDENPVLQELQQARGDILELIILSSEKLSKYSKNYHLSVKGGFCDSHNMESMMVWSTIYLIGEAEDENLYSIYIIKEWDEDVDLPTAVRKGNSPARYPKYDLIIDKKPICIKVVAGTMFGMKKESEIITIDSKMIQKSYKGKVKEIVRKLNALE